MAPVFSSTQDITIMRKAYRYWQEDPEVWGLASKTVFKSGKFNSKGQGPEREKATVEMYERIKNETK